MVTRHLPATLLLGWGCRWRCEGSEALQAVSTLTGHGEEPSCHKKGELLTWPEEREDLYGVSTLGLMNFGTKA